MNRALCWRAFARTFGAAVLLASAVGCGSEDEGSGSNAINSGGSSGVGGGSGGVGAAGAGGAAGMMTGGLGGTTGGASGTTGGAGASGGVGGIVSGGVGGMTGGASGMTGGGDPDGGMVDPDGGMAGMGGDGTCCDDGDCICREAPTGLTSDDGPYATESYDLSGVGCVYYPTDAEPPFAAVAISDGFIGTGGCGRTQTSGWGPFYASHGIVAMIVETGGSDPPQTRGARLIEGIEGFKQENMNSSSPLNGKLAGRYGTSGFSMGGGGTTFASSTDATLLSSVAMMPWGPTSDVTVPTLIICGATDRTASCASHGRPAYGGIADTVDKMLITVSGGHVGQPTAGGGDSGAVGLAFTKLYLEGDQRWKDALLSADYEETNIE